MKTKLMALEVLKNSRKELHACQAVIHLAGGFDPEYVRGAQAAMKNMDEAIAALEADIAKPVKLHGWMVSGVSRVYFGDHAEMDATQEARKCGGTAKAYPIYTTPQEPAAMWMPIETAPEDGTYILLGSADGSWIARYYPKYTSGYRPENPWQSMMLNHENMGRFPKAKPTHWMPLPAAPGCAA